MSFEDYAREWLATKGGIRPSTRVNIEGRLNKWAIPALGSLRMNAIKPSHARRLRAHLEECGLASSTRKGIIVTTNQVFEQAIEDELISKPPFAAIIAKGLPSEQSTEDMHFLTADQVVVLAEQIDPRYRAAVFLGAYGGLRAGEMWALRVERFDVKARTIRITESASEAGGWHIGPTKTGKPRTITIPDDLAYMLEDHIGRYAKGGFVFTAAEGGPVLHHNFKRRHYTKACIAMGLGAMVKDEGKRTHYEGVRFHDLRHTCAALLIAKKRDLYEIKDYLGHSSIRVTSDRYGHLYPEARADMADALNETLRDANRDQLADHSRTTRGLLDPTDANQRPRRALTREDLERTTGFEPATPTLARCGARSSHLRRRPLTCADTSRHLTPSHRSSRVVRPKCDPRNPLDGKRYASRSSPSRSSSSV